MLEIKKRKDVYTVTLNLGFDTVSGAGYSLRNAGFDLGRELDILFWYRLGILGKLRRKYSKIEMDELRQLLQEWREKPENRATLVTFEFQTNLDQKKALTWSCPEDLDPVIDSFRAGHKLLTVQPLWGADGTTLMVVYHPKSKHTCKLYNFTITNRAGLPVLQAVGESHKRVRHRTIEAALGIMLQEFEPLVVENQ